MSYRRTPRAPSAPHFPQSPAGDEAERLMREAMATANYSGSPQVPEPSEEIARPSVIVSLRDDGGLQVEIRGEALLRSVRLGDDPQRAIGTIHAILSGQVQRNIAIGLDGAPTQAQVRHWEAHTLWPNSECAFCIADGRIGGKSRRGARSRADIRGDGSVEVRTIPAGGKLASATTRTAEELGL